MPATAYQLRAEWMSMMTDSSFAEGRRERAGEEQRAEEVRLDVRADLLIGVGEDAGAGDGARRRC